MRLKNDEAAVHRDIGLHQTGKTAVITRRAVREAGVSRLEGGPFYRIEGIQRGPLCIPSIR